MRAATGKRRVCMSASRGAASNSQESPQGLGRRTEIAASSTCTTAGDDVRDRKRKQAHAEKEQRNKRGPDATVAELRLFATSRDDSSALYMTTVKLFLSVLRRGSAHASLEADKPRELIELASPKSSSCYLSGLGAPTRWTKAALLA